jgi:hypothetical protein
VDLLWASSSLHHVARPARLLSGAREALAPDGALIVVELAALPSFLNEPGDVLVEQHCHTAATAAGWNHYSDWTPALEAAGFVVSASEVATTAPSTPAAREYALQWFDRFSRLEGLGGDDRHAVAELLVRLSGGLALEPRSVRTVWVATPDQNRDRSVQETLH